MPCECLRCRQLARAVGSIGERELLVGGGAALLVLLPSLLVGIHPLVALLAAAGTAAAVVATSRYLVGRDDPLAPLPFEAWLAKHPEEWPWWLLGGIVALIGLLSLPLFRAALPMLVVGAMVAATPWVRQQLAGCGRVRAS
jgi:hypothetical protein